MKTHNLAIPLQSGDSLHLNITTSLDSPEIVFALNLLEYAPRLHDVLKKLVADATPLVAIFPLDAYFDAQKLLNEIGEPK